MKKQIFIVLLLVLWITSCWNDEWNNIKENKQVNVIEEKVEKEVILKEFEMDSFTEIIDWKYFPQFSIKNIEVNVWDTVRLKINTTKWTHDIRLDEFGVFAETPEWEVTTVEFIADKTGTFTYYCSKPNHMKNGHWGTIVVK